MHDDTEHQLVRSRARNAPHGYTLLVAYLDISPVFRNRITLWLISREGTIRASLSDLKFTRRRTDRYRAMEAALTNAFTESFGQDVTIRNSDFMIK